MKRLFGVFGGLVAILLVVACAFLLYLHTHELTRTATSSVETGYDIHGNEIVTTKNTRFIFETLEKDYPNETSLLLQETHEMRQTLYEDATQSTISVQAWIGKDISPTKPAWSFRQAGDAGDLDDEETFYRITEYPQADLAPTYTFYDLITGRKVYTSTSAQLFDIIVPNTGSGFLRYVAYHGRDSIDPPQECANDKSVEGVLQYGSEDHVQERVLVRASSPKMEIDGDTAFATIVGVYPRQSKTAFRPASNELWLWHSDEMASPKALSHFTLHVTLPMGHAFIDLPIENDQIDWSHVRHSPDIRLQEER